MSGKSSVTPHSVLEKYEFYFLALTFTLLGASIQTAELATYSHVAVIAEIVGWVAFIFSGIVGLSKIEYLSVLIYLRNRKSEFEKHKSTLEQARASRITNARIAETGNSISVDEAILQVDAKASNFATQLGRVGQRHETKHIIQKWAFLLGLISIAVARSYDSIVSIAGS